MMTAPIVQTAIDAVNGYNEAEVRFHIIDPIIRELGYVGRENVYVKLEEKLNYPYYYIGRKNSKKDIPLGFPDYRAGILGGRGSFIIETKAANIELNRGDIEQAHSYAAHAEIGADYFMICNGRYLHVYETLLGHQGQPIISLALGEVNDRFHELENLLSPENLERNCRKVYDFNLKLGDGLRSTVRIRDGQYDPCHWDYRIFLGDNDVTMLLKQNFTQIDEQLESFHKDYELRVDDGIVERDEFGRIVASVSFIGATKNNSAAMKLLGLNKMSFSTSDEFLSCDPDNPNIFESITDFNVSKGTKLPPMFGDAIPIDLDVDVDVYIRTRMYYNGDAISGDFLALANYRIDVPNVGLMRFELDLAGIASLRMI